MEKPILDIDHIAVGYGKVIAIPDISINLKANEIVTILGPNGAGKSTLLNAIMGILPLKSGNINCFGQNFNRLDIKARVDQGLSLVPEKRELFGTMSVEDNIILGGYRLKNKEEREKNKQHVFTLFPRLKERYKQLSGTLSGGERQMLAMARALMANPKILMLDEPSLGLAPLIVRDILQIVSELKDMGVSILLVEQNARAALAIADRAYVLEGGSITLSGSASDLAKDPRVVEAYLGANLKTTTKDHN